MLAYIYEYLLTGMMTKGLTHLPRVEGGVDGLMFEKEVYGYNYLLLDSELAATLESAGPETLTHPPLLLPFSVALHTFHGR